MANQHTKARDMEAAFLDTTRKRFGLASEYWKEIFEPAKEDLQFLAGDQWPDELKRQKDALKEPCITINRLWPYVHQSANEQRQNRPSIQVNPVDSQADPETAKTLQGIIRHIEYNSNADTAYTTAYLYACASSVGFFRILTDYVAPDSFDQEPLVGRIPDPTCVLFDPSSKEPDGSDANFAFIFEDLTREEFQRQFPQAEDAEAGGFCWDLWSKEAPDWYQGENVRVAEYWVKEYKSDTLYLVPGVGTKLKSQMNEAEKAMLEASGSTWKSRPTTTTSVKWYKISGNKILDETDWADGEAIPIIPVYGDELYVDGQRRLSGIVRFAKDPQRLYNYSQSGIANMIATAPKAPFIAAEGQIEGHEREWKESNIRNQGVLTYKPVDANGQLAPPPQRNMTSPAIAPLVQYAMQAVDDLKATTGIFDPSLGNREAAQSGIAITRLQNQAGVANFHYQDNLSKSLRHAGRILLRLIAKIYDTARSVRIVGDDGKQSVVAVNQDFEEKGQSKRFDLQMGKYDVTISTGPGYQTLRQEAQAFLERVIQAQPDLMQVAGDLFFRMQDSPMSNTIADRLEKTLPPNLKPEKDGEEPVNIPPEVQEQLAQAQEMIPQMQQEMEAMNAQMQELAAKNQALELQMKNKTEENDIKAFSAKSDADIKAAELELKEQEIALERGKLALESRKLRLEEEKAKAELLLKLTGTGKEQPEEIEEPVEEPMGFEAPLGAMPQEFTETLALPPEGMI